MKLDFGGRDVVVTGATGELGAAVVRLVSDAGGTVHAPSRADGIDLTDEGSVSRFYAGLPPLWASMHIAGGFAAAAIDGRLLAHFRHRLAARRPAAG